MHSIVQFLELLQDNNNRTWFQANKALYETMLKLPFEAFITDLIQALQVHAPGIRITAKDAIFRINRDTRFSQDKRPYKTNAGALISAQGRKNKLAPGYYIHIESGSLMIGGGAYFLERPGIDSVRQAILQDTENWAEITQSNSFRQFFDGISGEKNKRILREWQEVAVQHPEIANKQFYYTVHYPIETLFRPDIVEFTVQHFLAARPVNDFLAKALQI